MLFGVELEIGPGDIVLEFRLGPSPPPKGQNPQFSAHVCCSQTAGWIKLPLGREVDLGPGNAKGYSPQLSTQATLC